MSNALENSQIKQNEASTRQTEITTLLNLADTLDDKTIVQHICEALDIEYSEIEGRLPDKAEALNDFDNANGVLNEQL